MSLLLVKALLYRRATLQQRRVRTANGDINSGNEEKICRACCEAGDIPIFSDKLEQSIADDIAMCADITVSINDGFPRWLCKKCHKLLKNAIKFRKMCLKSAKKLHRIKEQQSETLAPPPAPEQVNMEYDDEADTTPASPPHSPWEDSDILSCFTCGQAFDNILAYRNHLPACNLSEVVEDGEDRRVSKRRRPQVQKEKGKYLCEICGKALSQPQSLTAHRTIHKNVFPFKCDQCPYRGKTKDLLKTHQRSHLAVKPYMCATCPRTFTTSSNLAKHSLMHQQLRPHKCPHCSKEFRDKDRLRRHVKEMHIGVAPVDCDVCGKRFSKRKSLRAHRLKVHNLKSERTGRLPSYLLCPPEEPAPASAAHAPHETLLPEQ